MDSIKMTAEQQLPEGWEYVPFNMFFNVVSISDKKISQKEYLDNGKYPVIDQGNLFIGGYSNDESLILKISSPVIVFGDHTKCFKYVSFPFVAGADGIKVLEPQNGIYPKYAYYYCLSIDLTDRGYARHFAFLKKCQFLIAPIETQQAIVNKIESLFDEIDEGIGRLKTAAQQIQQYRQSLLKNAFNGELTKEWRSKHADALLSENELLAQIQTAREERHAQQLADWQTAVSQWEQNGKEGKKPSKPKAPTQAVKFEENFADLPRGWGVIRFENICDLIRNGISVKPEGESGIKILRISAVRPFQLNLDDYRFLNTDDVGDFVLNNGDLLFTRYNGTRNFVGVCAEFKSDEKYVYPDKLIRAVVNSTKINSTFLMYGFNTGISRKFIESRIRTTAGQSGISGTDIKAIPVVICSPAEQTQIVAILESKLTACDQLAAELSNQLKQAELLKQAVLKAAFSGNLLDK
jgi:restriction modification system DNA specificity subunit